MALQDADDYVCSVKFTRDGNCIAVGTPQGDVELWDVGEMKKVPITNLNIEFITKLIIIILLNRGFTLIHLFSSFAP